MLLELTNTISKSCRIRNQHANLLAHLYTNNELPNKEIKKLNNNHKCNIVKKSNILRNKFTKGDEHVNT